MSGAAVDIISGRPLAEEFGQRVSRDTEAGNLMDQMRLAGIARTEAYRVVVQKVMEVLEQRIALVLNTDPQAKVCMDVLRAISAPEVTAQDAARRYVRRFNPLTPALGNETTPEKEMFP